MKCEQTCTRRGFLRNTGLVAASAGLGLALLLSAPSAHAAGECCTRGNLSTVGAVGERWSLQLEYDYSFMETLREGSDSISPDAVLDERLGGGAKRYAVPTEMVMQKYTLVAQGRVLPSWQVTVSVPYLVNDMDMRMAMAGAMGMVMKSEGPMATVEGLGDVTVGALYSILPGTSAGGWDAAVGLSLKMPTGKNDVRKEGSEALVHAMMQPGTGSWDPILRLQGGQEAGRRSVRFDAFYHRATRGDEGYKFGDMLGADVVARYRATSVVSAGLGVNFVHTGKDSDRDGKYTSPTSLIDNTDNTGLTALSVTPEVQVSVPGTGAALTLAYQHPLWQKVNGVQQVLDWRVLASLGWAF